MSSINKISTQDNLSIGAKEKPILNIGALLKLFITTFVFALILFGPITGMILNGFTLEYHLQRPLYLALIVAFIRTFLSAISNSEPGQTFLHRLTHQRYQSTAVITQDKKNHTQFLLISLTALILPFVLMAWNKYWLTIAIMALIYVLLGLGLNIVVGFAGLLNLGFVAFYAIGAYGYALGYTYLGMNFWIAVPLAGVTSAACGALLGFPVLRLQGDYLAIVTLGFGEIIYQILNNWTSFTGGPNGMEVPLPTLFNLEFTQVAKQGGTPFHTFFNLDYSPSFKHVFIYLTLLAIVLLMWLLVNRLQKMPMGRAWEALREDEIACKALGINSVSTKLSAFSMGAMVAGIGGVFFAGFQGFISPSSFTFVESALILSIVVLGGMGSPKGVVIAAIVLTLLPEIFRQFEDYRLLSFGAVLVMMMIWRPKGLVRLKRLAMKAPE